ncbi:MAG: hypothetical protein JWR35_3704 [Marmoricola sp.]|nr:hypothetical protein [Marmoricola sp.]
MAALVAVAAALGMTMIGAPANAAGQDGTINSGEFVFYYNSGCVNSYSDFAGSKKTLSGYTFLSSGAGHGQAVKNNAACAFNANVDYDAKVFYNSYCGGANDLIPAWSVVDLTNTYNENASFKFWNTGYDCAA